MEDVGDQAAGRRMASPFAERALAREVAELFSRRESRWLDQQISFGDCQLGELLAAARNRSRAVLASASGTSRPALPSPNGGMFP